MSAKKAATVDSDPEQEHDFGGSDVRTDCGHSTALARRLGDADLDDGIRDGADLLPAGVVVGLLVVPRGDLDES